MNVAISPRSQTRKKLKIICRGFAATTPICERFHKTILDEFYQIAFRKKIYLSLDELQKDLDDW